MESKQLAKKDKPVSKDAAQQFNEIKLQVIRLICAQLDNRQIATKLKRSLRTVEGYPAAILGKMKVKNTVGVVICNKDRDLYHQVIG